jgi:hypothetical protein
MGPVRLGTKNRLAGKGQQLFSNQSVVQSVVQSVSQSVSQSFSQSVGQSLKEKNSSPASQEICCISIVMTSCLNLFLNIPAENFTNSVMFLYFTKHERKYELSRSCFLLSYNLEDTVTLNIILSIL